MKQPIIFFTLFITVFSTSLIYSQSYIGLIQDNYAGVHYAITNPANIVDTPFKADINIISASAFGGSNYFGISISDIMNTDGGFDFDKDVEKYPKNDNTFFFNTDVLGPSFMFNLNKRSSIALTTRIRAFLNINNISGELYESLADGFDDAEDFNFAMENLNGTIHAWGEIGLTYARIFKQTDRNLLKGGVTIKYLQGAGSAFFNSTRLTGQFDSNADILTTQGDLNYGLSQEDFDEEDVNFKNLTTGLGIDIGIVYQWNLDVQTLSQDSLSFNYTPYKLKLGVSITDIGSINYKESEITQYNMDQSVDPEIFEDDVEQALEDNYNGVTNVASTKIKLPSAVHFFADYRIKGKFFSSLSGSFGLVSSDSETANSIVNTVTLAPRLETKWLSLNSPVSLRQYGDFAWGFGLRFGPLMIGSGSVLSNLLSNSTKTTDVYFGIKVPLYRKASKN